jgi:hypothetical protein
MKKLGRILTTIGVALFIIAPLFQILHEYFTNIPGDGDCIYGDNPVFRNILGVKTVNYYRLDGNWEYAGTELYTTTWMQKMGFDPKVNWGYLSYSDLNSDETQVACLVTLRWIIKLLIPLIFIIPGYILKNKYP